MSSFTPGPSIPPSLPPLPSPVPPPLPPKQQTRVKFNLHPLVFIIILAVAAVTSYLRWPQESAKGLEPALVYSRLMGNVIGAIGFPLLIGWIAFHLGRRNRQSGNITACVVATLVLGGAVLQTNGAEARLKNDCIAEIIKVREQQRQKLGRSLLQGEMQSDAEAGLRVAEIFHRYGQKMPNTRTGRGMLVMGDCISELMQARKSYEQALNHLQELGGIDVATIHSLPQIDERMAAVDQVLTTSEVMVRSIMELPDKSREAVDAIGGDQKLLDSFLKGFTNRKHTQTILALRQLDRDAMQSCKQILTILKAQWGYWSTTHDGLVFQSPTAADQYNKHLRALQTAGEQQQKLMHKFATEMQAQ